MDKVALANITITSIVNGFAIKSHSYDRTVIEPKSPLSSRSIKDAADFGWVKRWVAIGDSFTAGIGAGRPYSQSKSDRSCSRYDLAYPAVLNRLFGSVVQDSQYIACSGDRSVQIYEQAKALKGDLNLVVLTAGGNDLCLSQAVLEKAQTNIDTILKRNLKSTLKALNDEGGTKDQSWSFPQIPSAFWFPGLFLKPSPLTIERRKKFRTLVQHINKATQEVVEEISKDPGIGYSIATSDWDPWLIRVSRQFCQPGSMGYYPDPKTKELQFFKPDTHKRSFLEYLITKREEPDANEIERRQRLLTPRAARETAALTGRLDLDYQIGVEDSSTQMKRVHETISAFTLETIVYLRSKQLGLLQGFCSAKSEFKYWQKEGRKAYANPERMNENYKSFCDGIKALDNTINWSKSQTFLEGTPNEQTFHLRLSNDAREYVKEDCLFSFNRIINGRDGNDANNPMNWKFGGRWRENRPWPPIKKPHGSCEGWYKAMYSDYKLHGAGWSTYDSGRQTILPSIKGCLGLGVTAFKFKYFDEPDKDGMEWELKFHTPIWVRARCFGNNEVAFSSGSFTNGCVGND
ncbi:hypothetical protein H105_00529 [Trichophyton soudanense CBS 452.61]|uniref:SGNH hydrolase-type esterase domain-containing protein n=1 Tax=Trichophyton soudanense CBS 452.61 TaxID=1215331 RepID=A0A022Y602_TRISD|nr:hypothetical protein H105_00529 [Trichophyton soudanense CBS 452.61]